MACRDHQGKNFVMHALVACDFVRTIAQPLLLRVAVANAALQAGAKNIKYELLPG